ncbi:UDP-N-acetylmuramoylalanine--D-glutamate ligase [Thalassotalea insulae]|uniref:UDP-N-acetylmuramoylalanine--D-glutamate ligase n=1 Tax=Thalassotalea insulae TaxID=2056778 RepID=A0ABQ6GRI6_9GAMM|nr:UDP-N-acetylmuramoyl-L-alanine--D-glutamate ligase [Thalassotalea insulae]GLX77799.1 UDP-N-acetylmuramoylalanine--D-glutamate ligase [Thalassotalea insulae]
MELTRVLAELKNKRILVLGAGLTGMSCVKFLTQHHLNCQVNDSRRNVTNAELFAQNYPQCQLVLGQWDKEMIRLAQVIITSPGIDLAAQGLTEIISDSTKVIGDVELFCQLTDKPILAVTGSNGKSTVVSLLAHVGQKLGLNIGLGGNIGLPVLEQLANDVDCYVLELSSFQLETIESMQAVAAAVLNVSDDHLDRHKTLQSYNEIKQKVYRLAKTAVINRDQPISHSEVADEQTVTSFGSDPAESGHFGIITENSKSYLAFGEQRLIDVTELPLAGQHNALNYLAVLALGHSAGWPITEMVNAFVSFTGLPHRCQRVPSKDDICWINDSKATNVGATLAAINGLAPMLGANNKLILLAGGDGKGADFSPLQDAIVNGVAQLFTLGKDGEKIAALSAKAQQVADLPMAVKLARQCAVAGDIVLLSPACASIDMFKNFAERGQVFIDAVTALQEAS